LCPLAGKREALDHTRGRLLLRHGSRPQSPPGGRRTNDGPAVRLMLRWCIAWLLLLATGCSPAVPPDPYVAQPADVSADDALLLDGRDGRPLALDQFRPR